jgi:hypothetical protein
MERSPRWLMGRAAGNAKRRIEAAVAGEGNRPSKPPCAQALAATHPALGT